MQHTTKILLSVIACLGYLVWWYVTTTSAASTTIGLTIVESGSTSTGSTNTWSTTTWSTNTGGNTTGSITLPTNWWLFGGWSLGPTNSIITFSGGITIIPSTPAPVVDQELILAFEWAKKNTITRATTMDTARLYSPISRAELAKMMVQYITNVEKKSIPTNNACVIDTYKDATSMDSEQKQFITNACQLGIMWWKNDKTTLIEYFRPNNTVTRAEFATVLSRYLYGSQNNGDMSESGWYKAHLNALNQAKYIKVIDTPFMRELRGFVMLILYRIS